MTRPIRFIIVGLGHIGRRHAALVAAHPEAEVVAVVDPLPREQLNWPEPLSDDVAKFNQLAGALLYTQADVACICTPNGLHAQQAIVCMEAGLDVVIEKPIATTKTDAQAIATVAERTGKRVFGVMQNRYSPASAWLKHSLEQRALGEVLQVHLNCFWNRDHRYYTLLNSAPAASPLAGRNKISVATSPAGVSRNEFPPPLTAPHPWHGHSSLDAGVLYTQFAHFIDLLCWAFGEPAIDYARFANQTHQGTHDFPDTGTVQFTLPGGAIGCLNFSTAIWDQNFESTLTVIGTEGTIKLGGQYMNEVRYCHAKKLDFPDLPPSAPGNNYGGYTGSAANHHFVIDNVVDVLRGRAEIATPIAEGEVVVRTIENIYKAGGEA